MGSIFKPALILMSGRALGFAAAFCVPVVLARLFTPAEFGTYKQLFLVYTTLFCTAQFGMAESLYYFLPNSSREAGRYVLNALLALAALGLACFVLLATAGPAIANWMSNPALSEHWLPLGIFLWLTMTSAALEMVMVSRKQHRLASVTYGLSDVLRAALFIVPPFLLGGLKWLLLGAVAFAAIRFCGILSYLWMEFKGTLGLDSDLFKQQLWYAVPFGTAALVEILQSSFHQYAVSYYFDAATFAVYAVGCLQIPLVEIMASSVANVMMVHMAEHTSGGQDQAAVAMWNETTRKLALVFFPLVGLLLVNARELIVLLFTETYLASVPIFMVWSTVIVFAALPTDAVLRVYAQTRFLFLLSMLRLLVIAASIHWFLSTLHLVGGVVITVLALAVAKGLGLARMKGLWRVRFDDLLPWKSLGMIAGAATVTGIMTLLAKSALGFSTFPLLMAASFIYVAAYLVLVVWLRLLDDRERLEIAAWLHRWTVRPVKTEGSLG